MHVQKLILALLFAATAALNGADFNRDGHQDYLLSNNTTRQLVVWHLVGSHLVSGVYGPVLPLGWSIVGTGDFNRDGYPDLLLYNPATHGTAVWYLRDGTFLGGAYGPTFINGFVPKAVDDLDNDGNADIMAFNPNTGALWVVLMNNNQIKTSTSSSLICAPQSSSPQVGVAAEAVRSEERAVQSP